MKILIAGIPGTGKTTFGDFLAGQKGYTHIDMEEDHRTNKILENRDNFISTFFSEGSNIVVTWGFSPDQETIDIINYLAQQEFLVFWFDGNRDSSRKETLKRSEFDEETLQLQLKSLDEWNVPEKINAKIINVFDTNGNFRNQSDIAKEIGVI